MSQPNTLSRQVASTWIGRIFWPILCGIGGLLPVLVGASTFAIEPGGNDSLPPFPQVAETIKKHFGQMKHYEAGDIITRGEAQQTLDLLAKDLNWEIPNRAELEKLVLPDDAFLVRKLRTKAGTRFMRRVASYQNAYDRLDRLSAMSGGRRLIEDLIRGTGGPELIEYLSTSKGGESLGRMLARTKGGSDVNKQTGRIYTAESFIKAVEEIYADVAAVPESD